jgi:hypothetical protein
MEAAEIDELDHDWHEVGTSTSVSYRNLPPGLYHFLVAASDTNGLWSGNTATVAFTISPAFHQTNWFRALCAAHVLALAWAAYQLRLQQLRRRFAMTLEARVGERTRIARELHDTLLQSFHGVLLRLEVLSQVLRERPMEAQQTLDGTIDQAAEAITEGRDAVQGLRESTVQMNDLAQAVNTLGEELAANPANGRSETFRVSVAGEPRDLHPSFVMRFTGLLPKRCRTRSDTPGHGKSRLKSAMTLTNSDCVCGMMERAWIPPLSRERVRGTTACLECGNVPRSSEVI